MFLSPFINRLFIIPMNKSVSLNKKKQKQNIRRMFLVENVQKHVKTKKICQLLLHRTIEPMQNSDTAAD